MNFEEQAHVLSESAALPKRAVKGVMALGKRADLRIAELEHWITRYSDYSDHCVFDVLGRICNGCRCHRKPA